MQSKTRSTQILDAAQNYLRSDFSAVPKELKALPRWVCWREIIRDDKPTKLPINPKNGREAKSNEARTWDTYEQALTFRKRGIVDGIGFVLGPPYTGIDLDKCRNPKTEVIQPWAPENH